MLRERSAALSTHRITTMRYHRCNESWQQCSPCHPLESAWFSRASVPLRLPAACLRCANPHSRLPGLFRSPCPSLAQAPFYLPPAPSSKSILQRTAGLIYSTDLVPWPHSLRGLAAVFSRGIGSRWWL